MQLCLDTHERDLIARMPTAQVEPLTVGDIVVRKDGKDLVLIERKTAQDLAASIVDGRYREQSFRLSEIGLPLHRIVYLIEGSLDNTTMPKSTLMSSMISMWFTKGFTVVQTSSLSDTVDYLNHMFGKLQKEGVDDKEYVSTIKVSRKDKRTPEHIGTAMLAQIPSISTTIASALMQEYKSVPALVNAVTTTPECLATFQFGEKRRKLTKPNVANLTQFLS